MIFPRMQVYYKMEHANNQSQLPQQPENVQSDDGEELTQDECVELIAFQRECIEKLEKELNAKSRQLASSIPDDLESLSSATSYATRSSARSGASQKNERRREKHKRKKEKPAKSALPGWLLPMMAPVMAVVAPMAIRAVGNIGLQKLNTATTPAPRTQTAAPAQTTQDGTRTVSLQDFMRGL